MMTNDQKDTMLANIVQKVQSQILSLVGQNLIEESIALYREWEEHLDDRITEVEIITVNNLTII
jgi:hypothetical protein